MDNDICNIDCTGEIKLGGKIHKLYLRTILHQNYESCEELCDLTIEIKSSCLIDEHIAIEVELRFSPYTDCGYDVGD